MFRVPGKSDRSCVRYWKSFSGSLWKFTSDGYFYKALCWFHGAFTSLLPYWSLNTPMIEVGLIMWGHILCSLNYGSVVIWLGKNWERENNLNGASDLESGAPLWGSVLRGRQWLIETQVCSLISPLIVYALKHVDLPFLVITEISKAAFN